MVLDLHTQEQLANLRSMEVENRGFGDHDLADLTREAADAIESGCVLRERMSLRRISRYIESNRLSSERF